MKREPPIYREISEAERSLVARLRQCTMLPGSFDKRFVRSVEGAEMITTRQADYLASLLHKYRRQLARVKEVE